MFDKWHRNDGGRPIVHPLTTLLHFAILGVGIWAWYAGYWPAAVVCWLVCAHLAHQKIVAFHEASHGTLNPRFLMNEFQGIMLGTAVFIPLSVYRAVHTQHHSRISTEKDLEFWPFVDTSVSLWHRRLAAFSELTFGIIHSPLVFLRGLWYVDRLSKQQKVRIALEYAFMVAFWVALIAVCIHFGWLEMFLIGYGIQAWLAGNLQAINRYTEHMGLLGDSILTSTRTVVDPRLPADLISQSLLRIDYHGTHHRYAKIPYYYLPDATPLVYDGKVETVPVYSSYWRAFLDMCRTLKNPRIGAQWLRVQDAANAQT